MRVSIVLARLLAVIVLVAAGAMPPSIATAMPAAPAALDLTGTWTCCGQGGAPKQTWLITQTGTDLSGQARRSDGSLLGSITGKINGADVSIYVFEIATGSAVTYGGTATDSAMSGTWTDSYRGTNGTWRATRGDVPPDTCQASGSATARATTRRPQGVSPAAGCLHLAVKLTPPHQGGVSAGDRIKVLVTPTTKDKTGNVTVTVTPPDPRQARLLESTISDGSTESGGNLVWTMRASKLTSVSFSVVIRSDAKIDDPWADNTLGVVATAIHGGLSASVSKQVDLLPCGQRPPTFPDAPRRVAASGWTFKVGVDPRYGLAVDDLRLSGLDGAPSRLTARRISVPYLQLQTSRTTAAQSDAQVRLRPDGTEAFGRSRLLKLKLGGTSAGDDTSRVFAIYGIDHLGKGSGSCLLVRLSYEFKRYGTDSDCHPTAKIGYGDIALLKCSQFRPLLEYRFRGTDGEKLRQIQTVQRLHLDIDGIARSMAMVEDRDLTDLDPDSGNLILKRFVNPVTVEHRYAAIVNGEAGPWDNFHQRPTLNPVDVPADLVDGIARACGECLHMHWRWGRLAGGDLPGLGGTEPIIPEGSTQSAYLQLSKARAGEEGASVDKVGGDVERWTPANPTTDGDVALYWIVDNTQQHDAFFTHWVWAVPRVPTTARVAGQAFALATPANVGGYFCQLPPI